MTIRRVLVASLSTMLLALPASARAQFISCGSYLECERAYANQRARAIENEMMLKQMRETGEQRAQARAAIQQARTQFWATYPDKPGAEQARKEFSYWLGAKDIYYLREHLKAPVMKDEHGRRTATAGANFLDTFGGFDEKIDDGIRPSALHEFEDWAMAVRDKLFEGHTSSSTDDAFMQGLLATWMGQKFWDAVAANTKQYDAYVTLRDWWEFDQVNRVPAGFETPATYGIYLYARFRKVPLPAATSNYKKMTELLGVERASAFIALVAARVRKATIGARAVDIAVREKALVGWTIRRVHRVFVDIAPLQQPEKKIRIELFRGGWDPVNKKHIGGRDDPANRLLEKEISGGPYDETYAVKGGELDPVCSTLSIDIRSTGYVRVSLVAVEISY